MEDRLPVCVPSLVVPTRAAETISRSKDDLRDQRRHLVDIAYRVDSDFAKQLTDKFDSDEAKKRAQAQVRLLEVRRTINELEGKPNQEKLLSQVRGAEVHKLGMLFLKGLSAGRIQHYHPNEIREYMDLAANQPLKRSFPMLIWYVENAISRYAQSDQAVTFLRPLFDACVVGAQLAGQISGRSLIRLKALKRHSNELSNVQSLLITPESKEDAIRILVRLPTKNKRTRTVDVNDGAAFAPINVEQLVAHYKRVELPLKAHSTAERYKSYFDLHIIPKWGKHSLSAIKSVEVEIGFAP